VFGGVVSLGIFGIFWFWVIGLCGVPLCCFVIIGFLSCGIV